MSELKEKLTAAVINFKYGTSTVPLLAYEDICEKLEGDKPYEIKNMCAKVIKPFDDKVTNTAAWLGMSKREFIELAVRNAVQEAESLAKEYKVFDSESDQEESK